MVCADELRRGIELQAYPAPSLQGLNPRHAGNGIDGAYASNLDDEIAALSAVPV